MNTSIIFTAVLSCLLMMLAITHSFAISDKNNDGEHHSLIGQSSVFLPNQLPSIYQDDGSLIDYADEHELEKRRFNAWAGKRNLLGKRRFNAWAGRR